MPNNRLASPSGVGVLPLGHPGSATECVRLCCRKMSSMGYVAKIDGNNT